MQKFSLSRVQQIANGFEENNLYGGLQGVEEITEFEYNRVCVLKL